MGGSEGKFQSCPESGSLGQEGHQGLEARGCSSNVGFLCVSRDKEGWGPSECDQGDGNTRDSVKNFVSSCLIHRMRGEGGCCLLFSLADDVTKAQRGKEFA